MSQKKEQKTAEKSVAGPLRKHRTRTEKIDDLKKQKEKNARKQEMKSYLLLVKLFMKRPGSQRIFMACNSLWNQKNLKWILKTISNREGAF